MDLTTPDNVAEYMKQSTSRQDWNERTNEVKKANGGKYPDFWWITCVESGIQGMILGINVTNIYADGTTKNMGTYDPVTGEQIC